MMYPPKWMSRASPNIVISNGNHGVEGLVHRSVETDRIVCLHAPLRARALLIGKLDQGRRVIEDEGRKDYWHVRRWWRLSRHGEMEAEWAANSYENGSITVAKQERPLVTDSRLHDVVARLNPTKPVKEIDPRDAMAPPIAAYLLALDTVPGRFSSLDFRLFVEVDRVQREHEVRGDLVEIGVDGGKSAILLGYLARLSNDGLWVCDPFENVESVDDENRPESETSQPVLRQQDFVDRYLRFHSQPPSILVGSSKEIDVEALAGTCRLIHIDGSHTYDMTGQDIRIAERMLGDGAIVACDGISTAHNPGAALAIWEEVLRGRFVPLCLTDAKLYGTWDGRVADWRDEIDDWVARNGDVECEIHTLGGWPVRRLYLVPQPSLAPEHALAIPSLEELEAVATFREIESIASSTIRNDEPTPRPGSMRRLARLFAPPIAVSLYRRFKTMRT